jgi:hypothetical protein
MYKRHYNREVVETPVSRLSTKPKPLELIINAIN